MAKSQFYKMDKIIIIKHHGTYMYDYIVFADGRAFHFEKHSVRGGLSLSRGDRDQVLKGIVDEYQLVIWNPVRRRMSQGLHMVFSNGPLSRGDFWHAKPLKEMPVEQARRFAMQQMLIS